MPWPWDNQDDRSRGRGGLCAGAGGCRRTNESELEIAQEVVILPSGRLVYQVVVLRSESLEPR